ncbi:hypothetical protein MMC22_009569 [Lobaria immixta]|nr:hypothetical protein [Lobaria immixta]
MPKFYFGDSDSSSDTDLPYPQPLTRASFLTPTFSPTTFLSSLRNRHQTLEDLRSELRARSQELNKELLDLVNENYQDFLLLGSSLHGGEEKVEEVRVGLLGFKRDVEGLKEKVEGRRKEVEGLVEERKRIRSDVQVARSLLEVNERIGELEHRLMVVSSNGEDGKEEEDADFSDSEEDSEEENQDGVSASRLKRHAQRYLYIRRLVDRIGPSHPFLVKQEERILRLRQTVLLDLGNALKQMSSASDEDKARLMKILGVYRDMGESEEALKIVKERKRSA